MKLVFRSTYVDDITKKGLEQISTEDLSSVKNHKRQVDIGCAATNILNGLQRRDEIDEPTVFAFHNKCLLWAFIIAVIEKSIERILVGMDFFEKGSFA